MTKDYEEQPETEEETERLAEEEIERPAAAKPEFVMEIAPKLPEGQLAQFSNFAAVQHDGHEFHLLFFEVHPPLLVGSDQERKRKLSEQKSIDAHCVSRIVMSASRIPSLITALKNTYKNYLESQNNDD